MYKTFVHIYIYIYIVKCICMHVKWHLTIMNIKSRNNKELSNRWKGKKIHQLEFYPLHYYYDVQCRCI